MNLSNLDWFAGDRVVSIDATFAGCFCKLKKIRHNMNCTYKSLARCSTLTFYLMYLLKADVILLDVVIEHFLEFIVVVVEQICFVWQFSVLDSADRQYNAIWFEKIINNESRNWNDLFL